MRHSILIVTLVLAHVSASAAARAETPAPPPPPPTTSVDGAAGARGEEGYFPGPGGGKLEDGGLPLESTGLEDGPGGCKCALAVGSRSRSHGAAWLALGLGTLAVLRRRKK